jgi:hypothetical protein
MKTVLSLACKGKAERALLPPDNAPISTVNHHIRAAVDGHPGP